MPQVTVYVREEDMETWKSIKKKSEFLHNALSGVPTEKDEKEAYPIKRVAEDLLFDGQKPIRKTIKSLGDLHIPKSRLENGVCKVHGTPLDDRGKCLMKGCKYS